MSPYTAYRSVYPTEIHSDRNAQRRILERLFKHDAERFYDFAGMYSPTQDADDIYATALLRGYSYNEGFDALSKNTLVTRMAVKDIDGFIDRHSSDIGLVHHGVSLPLNVIESLGSGTTINLAKNIPFGTSESKRVARDFSENGSQKPCVFNIHTSKKGFRMGSIAVNRDEQEVVFKSNSTVRVISRRKCSDETGDYYEVDCEM